MCGIAGGVLRHTDRRNAVARMTDALAQRGPDDAGYFDDDESGVTLGHRRLAILDLTSAGHQPMAVHPGEIYNHRELRDELIALGHRFRTGTDTEVLLAAFEVVGLIERCPAARHVGIRHMGPGVSGALADARPARARHQPGSIMPLRRAA